jgi:hypothetical protein
MPNVWTRAFAIEPPVILGYRLRPLAAHHVLALSHLDNHYLTGAVCGIDDLVSVPLICADDYRHRFSAYRRFSFSRRAKTMMMFRLRGVRGQLAHEQITDYLAKGVEEPELWQGDAPADGSLPERDPVPWALRLAATVMEHYHLSLEDAMNLPIAQAAALTAVLANSRGVKLVNEDQIAEMEAALCQT